MAEHESMSAAQRAYEEKQAKKAGKSLEAWLAQKRKRQAETTRAAKPAAARKPGLLSRLMERANKPL